MPSNVIERAIRGCLRIHCGNVVPIQVLELIVDRSQTRNGGPSSLRISLPVRSTVSNLQAAIAAMIGLEPDRQYLEFNNQVLSDRPNKRLSLFGISNLSSIRLEDRGSITATAMAFNNRKGTTVHL